MSQPSPRLVAYERSFPPGRSTRGSASPSPRKGIGDFAAARGAEVIVRFTEVESDKAHERPDLAKALQLAKLTGATLVIARLDRLSRNAAFLLTLRPPGVRFLACDMPEVNDLTAGITALGAQQIHALCSKPGRKLAGDVRRAVIAEQPRPIKTVG